MYVVHQDSLKPFTIRDNRFVSFQTLFSLLNRDGFDRFSNISIKNKEKREHRVQFILNTIASGGRCLDNTEPAKATLVELAKHYISIA